MAEGEKKKRAEMSHLGSHCFNVHIRKEIWLAMHNSNRVRGGEVTAVGEKKKEAYQKVQFMFLFTEKEKRWHGEER